MTISEESFSASVTCDPQYDGAMYLLSSQIVTVVQSATSCSLYLALGLDNSRSKMHVMGRYGVSISDKAQQDFEGMHAWLLSLCFRILTTTAAGSALPSITFSNAG